MTREERNAYGRAWRARNKDKTKASVQRWAELLERAAAYLAQRTGKVVIAGDEGE